MEKQLKLDFDHIHHLDCDVSNNNISNLEVVRKPAYISDPCMIARDKEEARLRARNRRYGIPMRER